MLYKIEFAASVERHLRYLTATERGLVLDAIEARLGDQPLVEARNRKPLRPNPFAPWELRVGALRVFYEADHKTVRVLAIGKKTRRSLKIAGIEIKL